MSNTVTTEMSQLSQTAPTPIKEVNVQYNTKVLSTFLSWVKDENIVVTTFLRQGLSLKDLTFKASGIDGIVSINKHKKTSKDFGSLSPFASNEVESEADQNKMWIPLNKISSVSPKTTSENKFVHVPDHILEEMTSNSNVECLGHLFAQTLKSNGKTILVFLEKGKKKIYQVLAFDSMVMLCRNEMGSHELVFFQALQNLSAHESIEKFEERIERNIKSVEMDKEMSRFTNF